MASGRKRKVGSRTNGRLNYSSQPTHEPITGVIWQRIARLTRDGKADPRAVSEVARLHAYGAFSDKHAIVGLKIGEIYGRFERLIGCSRSVKGFSYDVGFRGMALLSEEQEAAHDERERKARTAFDDLQKELRTLSRDAVVAIETLCVEDRHILPIWHDELRAFFGRLAMKWGVTAGQKHGGARPGSGPTRTTITATTQIVEKSAEPAKPKPNADRVAWFKAMRVMRPDLRGEGLKESYELWRALKDQTAYRLKTDRKRLEDGKGLGYVPPSAVISPTAAITNRPVLELSAQQELAA